MEEFFISYIPPDNLVEQTLNTFRQTNFKFSSWTEEGLNFYNGDYNLVITDEGFRIFNKDNELINIPKTEEREVLTKIWGLKDFMDMNGKWEIGEKWKNLIL